MTSRSPALLRTRLVPLALALAAACAPRADPRLVAQPIAGRSWVSTLHRDHPLVGRIWDGRAGALSDEAALAAAVAGADFVLLGEVHDNGDHHLLQARLVRAILDSGRRPALAFEMLTSDQQPQVDASIARAPRDADALARAVDWKGSRWPDFAWYRPIFAAGLEAGLPIVAANLPRDDVRAIVRKGADALAAPLRAGLARDEPVPADVLEGLRDEMRDSHCNELPEAMIDPLVLAQRARDLQMALRMAEAGKERGAILVTGNGHARTDRGVPAALGREAPGRRIVSVGFLEVDAAATDPAAQVAAVEKDLGASRFPFDFAVFTPGAKRDDPCEGLRERSRARAGEAAQGPAEGAKPAGAAAAPDGAPPAPPGAAPAR
jgi:uncharacterized iron-regulated protein